MKPFKLSLLVYIFFAVPFYAFAQQKELPPEGGSPKNFTIPKPDVNQLENGMKVVMVEHGILPKVTLRVYVATGSINEASDKVGVSDLLAELMKEGTQNRDAKTLSKEFAKMGGALNINAGTHEISFSTTVLSEFAPQAVELLGEVIQRSLLPASELDRLKSNMKRQMSVARSQPQQEASRKFYKAIYGDHPYGRDFPADALIDRHTIEDIRQFFDEQFGAQRSTLYIVGKFNKQAVLAAAKSNFNDWKTGNPKEYPLVQPQVQAGTELLDRPNSPQATIRFGIPVPDPSHPDYYPLEVMNGLLGGSFSSRITSNIREDKGYTYSPFSTVSNRYKNALWYQAADITIEKTGAALLEISREIDRLQNEAPTKEELAGIQNYMAGTFVLQNSATTGIIGQLYFIDFHGLGENYLNERVNNIMSVTPEQVREMAQKYLDPQKMFLTVVGDMKQTQNQISDWEKAGKSFQP